MTGVRLQRRPDSRRPPAKPDSRRAAWECLRRNCRAIVPDAGTVCLSCLLADAGREETARRVHTVTADQRGTSGADGMMRECERRRRNRDKILKAVVTTTAGTDAWAVVLAAGLGRLLTAATADSAALSKWLAGKGVTAGAGGWTCSRSIGRSGRCLRSASA